MSLLVVEDLDVHYGDFHAIRGVSLQAREGETLAVIGANGAGKSTLLKAIAGLLPLTRGRVVLDGQDVGHLPAHKRAPLGISLTPEGRRLFPQMSVRENLLVGASTGRSGPWTLDAVLALFPLVAERLDRTAANLSGGEQQAVAIGRSLMANPRLLLLDEVSLGLAPVVVKQLYTALPQVVSGGTTVLLVEQDVGHALSVAQDVHCLLEGRTALHGPASAVTREQIADAYFGTAEAVR